MQLKSFLDITFDSKVDLSKILIHPFINLNGKFSTNDTSEKLSSAKGSLTKNEVNFRDHRALTLKESMGEEKSEFTFGSGPRNSHSSKSSESNYFPPEVKKFLTKGSALESSSGGVGSESQRTSFDYFQMHRFSEITNQNSIPTNSPAVPLRVYDRNNVKPIYNPMTASSDTTNTK